MSVVERTFWFTVESDKRNIEKRNSKNSIKHDKLNESKCMNKVNKF
jgi:hypothetical protein